MTAGQLLVQEAIRPDTDVDLHLAADLIPKIVKNLRRGLKIILAPTAGFEPATSKLTASCSTIELRRNTNNIITANDDRGQAWFSRYKIMTVELLC
jgi:hypothetical protein